MTPASAPIGAVPLWLDLLQVRAELAETGYLAVPYARRHAIDLAAVEPAIGVPVLAAVRYGADRSFDPGGRTPSMVIEARGEDGDDVLDLVAWPLERPTKFARLYGRASVLGAHALLDLATYRDDRPVRMHRTPLAWLQARCDGAVLLDPVRGGRVLLDAPGRIAAEDDAHAGELAAALEASLRLDRIVVPMKQGA